jgi:hypothetical protein
VMWPSPPHFFASLTPHLDSKSSLRRHNRFHRRHLFKNSPDNIVPHCQYNVVVGLNHSGDIQTHSHSHTDEGLVLECRVLYRAIEPTENSVGEYLDWSSACEMRLWSEENRGRGKVRRRRGRRLLIMRRLLLLRCLFCGLLRCCFLRCHENSTPLRCQTVNQCMCGIAEFGQRVKFCFLDFPGRSG